jgi:hypothetical protein
MNINIYDQPITFITSNIGPSKELGILARNILNNELNIILTEKCKTDSLDATILKEDPELGFINNEILHFFYVFDFLNEKSLDLNSDSDWYHFFKNLYSPSLNHVRKKVGYKFHDLVFMIANRFFHLNIPLLILRNPEANSRPVRDSYFDILPYLLASDDELIDALFVVTNGIKPEDNYLNLNQSIKEKSKNNPQFGYSLIEKSKPLLEKSRLAIPFAFIGITETIGIKKSFPLLKELLQDSDDEYKKIGLRCLSMLNGDKDNLEEIQLDLMPLLENIESTGNDSLHGELTFTYGLLIEKLPVARQKLIIIPAKNPGNDTFFALAKILHFKIINEINEKWVSESLKKFSNLFQRHIGTYSEISWALYGIIEKYPRIVLDYLEDFVRENQNSIDDLKAFKNVFSELAEENFELYCKWITILFNKDESRFHHAASKILTITENKKQVKLDPIVINELTPFDLEFMVYKIVGYVYSKEHLESLVYSALSYTGEIDFVKQLVTQIFCHYITYNYPGSLKYLQDQKNFANRDQKEAIEIIEQHFNEIYSIRTEKPKELSPSLERLQLFFNQTTKQFGTLEDRSRFRETSFLDMVTKVSIKTGSSFFSRDEYQYGMQNRYSNKSTMGLISHSFEFPSGEFLDPVGQEYNRYIWRNFKRRKK